MLNHFYSGLLATLILCPQFALGDKATVRLTAEQLPAKLAELREANDKALAGSTVDMVNAAHSISEELISSLIALLADGKPEADQLELRTEIERDAQGIAAGVYYDNHALGWGGTITRIEASFAYWDHIEVRISHAITRLFEDDETFDLEAWRKAWEEAGGNIGGGSIFDEEAEEDATAAVIRLEDGELRFSAGSSGGILSAGVDEWTAGPVGLGARPGQRLLLASAELEFQVRSVAADGNGVAAMPWRRTCDLELPATTKNRYQIFFRLPAGKAASTARILIEIR